MDDAPTYHHLTAQNAHLLKDADVFDHATDPAQLAGFVADPGHELVFATYGGEVVGFASGTVLLHPDKPPAFFVNEVGVNEGFRQRGIATALCNRLYDIARNLGCKGIWLATETDNIAARALYRGLDARETEKVVVYDWDGAMDDPGA